MHLPDSRRSWVVCLAGVLSSIIVHGCSFSYGVLFPVLLDEFGEGKAKTAWVGSLAMAGYGIYAPVAGKLNDRFGERLLTIFGAILCATGFLLSSQAPNINVLFVTFGVIAGFGFSSALLAIFMIVSKYFVKRRSFAMGFMSLGSAGGITLMSPLIQYLLDTLDWKRTFMSLAGVELVVCVLAFSFDPNVMNVESDRARRVLSNELETRTTTRGIMTSLLKNKMFMTVVFASVIAYTGHMIPSVHLVRHCEDLGIPANQASRLYVFFGVASVISRVVSGRVYDISWVNPRYPLQLSIAVSGIATLLMPLATSYTPLILYSIAYGLADGGLGSSGFILMAKLLAEEERALGYGIYSMIVSFGYAGGPPLGGFVADTTGSYKSAFFMAGSLCVFAAAFISLASLIKSTDKNNTSPRQHDVIIVMEKLSVV